MKRFQYAALDRDGKASRGFIEAQTPREARGALRQRELAPLSVTDAGPEAGRRAWRLRANGSPRETQMPSCLRQLGMLLSGGSVMTSALEAVAEEAGGDNVFRELKALVSAGSSLSGAARQFPHIFSDFQASVMEAGERSGNLTRCLMDLAVQMEARRKLRQRVLCALIYPVITTAVAIASTCFLLFYVLPGIIDAFSFSGAKLPMPTRILLAASSALAELWWLAALLVAAIVIAAARYSSTKKGKRNISRLLLSLPLYGDLVRKAETSHFFRSAGMLLEGGLPVIPALEVSVRTVTNTVMKEAVECTIDAIARGESIGANFKAAKVFPPSAVQMVTASEASGTLGKTMMETADAYDEEVGSLSSGIVATVEPALIILMGAVIGFAVIALLSPILTMSTTVG